MCIRMHPCESEYPIEPSSGVPWMPTPGALSPIQRVPSGLPGPGGTGFSPAAHGEIPHDLRLVDLAPDERLRHDRLDVAEEQARRDGLTVEAGRQLCGERPHERAVDPGTQRERRSGLDSERARDRRVDRDGERED